MDPEISKTLAQYGLSGILLGVVGWIVWKVGLRMIAAIDRVAARVDEHTKIDLEHHGEVRDAVTELSTKVDMLFELTPVEGPPKRRTHPRGIPVGEYGLRPRTRNEDDR